MSEELNLNGERERIGFLIPFSFLALPEEDCETAFAVAAVSSPIEWQAPEELAIYDDVLFICFRGHLHLYYHFTQR